MQKLSRTLVFITAAMLIVFTLGCGSDEEESSNVSNPTMEEKSEPPLGLHGDTYRNQRYVFKVSNLPVDDWTIHEVSNAASREVFKNWEEFWLAIFGSVQFNKSQALLLVQPTSKENFQDTLIGAFENQMPFIFIWVEKQTITGETTPQQYALTLLEQMVQLQKFLIRLGFPKIFDFEVASQDKIVSKDRIPGYFYELTWLPDRTKTKEAFFMRKGNTSFVYRFQFWSPANRYDELVPVFDQIVSSFELNLN